VTSILTWNIQCGLGADGRVDLVRVVDVIKEMGGADIICLQEVSRFDSELDGGEGVDQVSVLSALFPDHFSFFGPALNRQGNTQDQRRQFGNLILSRLPVLQVFKHLLPQPAPEGPCKHMPRQALEVVVEANDIPLRITTTHLEYHSEAQRLAQIRRLLEVQAEVVENQQYLNQAPSSGPYGAVPRPAQSILCGDFNSDPGDLVYNMVTSPQKITENEYIDAWRVIKGLKSHAPTCGIYDHTQWPQGGHCRDFFFISKDLCTFAKDIEVQQETNASDHQPILLHLKGC
jgi:endonuclease/exonuclease/phosphatase family metal-dependent hydrolase